MKLSDVAALLFKHRVAFLLVWVLCWVGCDQATKVWAQGALAEERTVVRPKEVLSPDGTSTRVDESVTQFFAKRSIRVHENGWFGLGFKYAENRAAAFSLTESIPEGARRPILLLVSIGACALITVWYLRLKVADGLLMLSFALIIGGALGNFLDRLRLSYVIDFLDMYATAPGAVAWLRAPHSFLGIGLRMSEHWPTYNVADIGIVSGAIGVLLRTFKPLPDSSTGAAVEADAPTATPAKEAA
ncbi:MAG: signal peptidase II [Deltaproteobacteria bacterium]|nr:signal peptidase II [Deltaproteobacteria bacterium]